MRTASAACWTSSAPQTGPAPHSGDVSSTCQEGMEPGLSPPLPRSLRGDSGRDQQGRCPGCRGVAPQKGRGSSRGREHPQFPGTGRALGQSKRTWSNSRLGLLVQDASDGDAIKLLHLSQGRGEGLSRTHGGHLPAGLRQVAVEPQPCLRQGELSVRRRRGMGLELPGEMVAGCGPPPQPCCVSPRHGVAMSAARGANAAPMQAGQAGARRAPALPHRACVLRGDDTLRDGGGCQPP